MASHMRAFNIRHAANDEDPAPVLQKTALSLVRRDGADLTVRQLGIFLTVYLDEGKHTVRGLAALFSICKPAVTRSLDRLGELGLVRRKVDPRDRRSVLVHRTELGWVFLGELRRAVGRAADEAEWAPASRVAAPSRPDAAPPRPAELGRGYAAIPRLD